MDRPFVRLLSALEELRRRRIFQVAAVYCVVAWLVLQVANTVFPPLGLPQWGMTLLVVLALLGLPLAMVLGWAFDLSPSGVARTADDAAGGSPGSRLARALVVGMALVLTAAGGWLAWRQWIAPEPEAAVAAEEAPPPSRLAVLYFDDHSPSREFAYLADGLTEALIHELSQVEELDVISRHGVKPFRDGSVTLDSIVRALRIGTLIEGSVQATDDSIRVTAQLVDAATASHEASLVVERAQGELFALQDSLVARLAGVLRRRLGTEIRLRERRDAAESVEAWTLVQKAERLREDARQLRLAGDSTAATSNLRRADSLLARATVLDTTWVEPVVLRAALALDRAEIGSTTPASRSRAALNRAREHAEAALALSPGSPAALEVRGMAGRRLAMTGGPGADALRLQAEEDLRAAVREDPSRAVAWSELGDLLRNEGRFAEASLAAERALEADAFLAMEDAAIFGLYETTLELGDTITARRWCDEGRRRFPSNPYFYACALFNVALFGYPDVPQAWRLRDSLLAHGSRAEETRNRSASLMWVASVLARAAAAPTGSTRGEALRDSARALVQRARTIASGSAELRPWLDYYEAHVRLHVGERDAALWLLERHLEALPEQREHLREDWMFDGLREDPRYRNLLRSSSEGG